MGLFTRDPVVREYEGAWTDFSAESVRFRTRLQCNSLPSFPADPTAASDLWYRQTHELDSLSIANRLTQDPELNLERLDAAYTRLRLAGDRLLPVLPVLSESQITSGEFLFRGTLFRRLTLQPTRQSANEGEFILRGVDDGIWPGRLDFAAPETPEKALMYARQGYHVDPVKPKDRFDSVVLAIDPGMKGLNPMMTKDGMPGHPSVPIDTIIGAKVRVFQLAPE